MSDIWNERFLGRGGYEIEYAIRETKRRIDVDRTTKSAKRRVFHYKN